MKNYIDNVTKEIYAYESDGSQDAYIKFGLVPISDEDLSALRISQIVAPTYKDLRATAYPSFADQFDTIFHNGLDAWKVEIQAVKDKYPKG